MSKIDWQQSHQPGPRNDIHDVKGILAGHAQSQSPATGTSLFVFPEGSVGAVDVRGGAPGSRETEALAPGHVTDRLDGIFLSGGSAHGLATGSSLTEQLRDQNTGIKLRPNVPPVPIVAGAVIYDLTPDHTDHNLKQLYEDLADQAWRHLGQHVTGPRDGAGAGARDALGKGGMATASYCLDDIQVGAIMIANPVAQN
jgi:L-aminopeptidase/D-esterase-like protein